MKKRLKFLKWKLPSLKRGSLLFHTSTNKSSQIRMLSLSSSKSVLVLCSSRYEAVSHYQSIWYFWPPRNLATGLAVWRKCGWHLWLTFSCLQPGVVQPVVAQHRHSIQSAVRAGDCAAELLSVDKYLHLNIKGTALVIPDTVSLLLRGWAADYIVVISLFVEPFVVL